MSSSTQRSSTRDMTPTRSMSATSPSATTPSASASASTATETARGARRPPPLPLPAVKGTMGGIETPKRDIWSPGLRSAPGTPTASAPPSLAEQPSTALSTAPSTHTLAAHAASAEAVVFRADPRLRTCFEGMPEGGAEVARLFGV